MICSKEIRLATISDALRIAEMSRAFIESGLGWSWTSSHVVREIGEKHSNVVVVVEGNEVIGFAVMKYLDGEARLNLLGVNPKHRRKGVGSRMIKWLEETALINGDGVVYLETRLSNHGAREFYKSTRSFNVFPATTRAERPPYEWHMICGLAHLLHERSTRQCHKCEPEKAPHRSKRSDKVLLSKLISS